MSASNRLEQVHHAQAAAVFFVGEWMRWNLEDVLVVEASVRANELHEHLVPERVLNSGEGLEVTLPVGLAIELRADWILIGQEVLVMRLVCAQTNDHWAVNATIEERTVTLGRGASGQVGSTRGGAPRIQISNGSVDATFDIGIENELDRPAKAIIPRATEGAVTLRVGDSILPASFDLEIAQVKDRNWPHATGIVA